MNWKKLASSALAASAAAAVLALAHALAPKLSPEAQTLLASGAAAVAHWLDAWGSGQAPANADGNSSAAS